MSRKCVTTFVRVSGDALTRRAIVSSTAIGVVSSVLRRELKRRVKDVRSDSGNAARTCAYVGCRGAFRGTLTLTHASARYTSAVSPVANRRLVACATRSLPSSVHSLAVESSRSTSSTSRGSYDGRTLSSCTTTYVRSRAYSSSSLSSPALIVLGTTAASSVAERRARTCNTRTIVQNTSITLRLPSVATRPTPRIHSRPPSRSQPSRAPSRWPADVHATRGAPCRASLPRHGSPP